MGDVLGNIGHFRRFTNNVLCIIDIDIIDLFLLLKEIRRCLPGEPCVLEHCLHGMLLRKNLGLILKKFWILETIEQT